MYLPTDLEPGAHKLVLRGTDEYGREHVTNMVLEVAG
jgi:hypothetical protein